MGDSDDLTGLLTRGAVLRQLENCLTTAGLEVYAVCLLVVDLDYLKTINDSYGHLAGDAALRAVAALVRAALPAAAVGGRYGGDELMVVLPGATLEEGLALAERLRAAVADLSFTPPGHSSALRLSLSIGAALFPQEGSDVATLFAAADQGVYAAKAAGRNCVRIAPSAEASDPSAGHRIASQTRLVGREAELHQLRLFLDKARHREGHLVVLQGEAGIGKTRLTEEIACLASMQEIQVARARCHQVELASPYHPFLEAVTAIISNASSKWLRQKTGVWAGELSRLLPLLKHRLPDVEPLAALPPEEDRQRLQQALSHLLLNLAQTPTLLIIDDLHWADETSIRVLNRLARQLQGVPLLLLCTVRSEDLSSNPTLPATLANLGREGHCAMLPISALSPSEATTLLHIAMGLRWSADPLQRRLIEETEGNPLFLLETLQLLIDRQVLRPHDGHWSAAPEAEPAGIAHSLPLAPTVQQVIGERLQRLTASQRDLLAASAVLGQRFEPDMLEELASTDEDSLWSLLEFLEQQRLIVPSPPPGSAYSFAHPLIHQVTYRSISVPRRQSLHRKVAHVLSRSGALPGDIADHHWQGGQPEPAYHLFLQAAAAAAAIHAVSTAIGYYQRALIAATHLPAIAAAAQPPSLAALYECLGDLYDLDGNWKEALSSYDTALRLLDPLVQQEQAGLWCKIGSLYNRTHQPERALAAYEAAAGRDGGLDLPATTQAAIMLGRAHIHLRQTNYAAAAALAETARTLLTTVPEDSDLILQSIDILGAVTHRQGDLEVAATWFVSGLRLAEGARLDRWLAHFQGRHALVIWQQGDLNAAQRLFEQALVIAERLGDQYLQADCLHKLASTADNTGHPDKAVTWYRRALALHERSGFLEGVAAVQQNLGVMAEETGDYVTAQTTYVACLALAEEVGNRRDRAIFVNSLGRVALLWGNLTEAASQLQQALALAEALGDPSPLGHCLYLHAVLALERGDLSALDRACRQARALSGCDPEDSYSIDLLEARTHMLAGHPEEAMPILHTVTERLQSLPTPSLMFDTEILLAQAYLALNDRARAEQALEHVLMAIRTYGYRRQEGQAMRLLGQIAITWDQAAPHLFAAQRLFDTIGAVLEAARTQVILAIHPAQVEFEVRSAHLSAARCAFQIAGAHGDLAALDRIPVLALLVAAQT